MAGAVDVSLDKEFIPSVNQLAARESRRVWQTVEKFQGNPHTPSLNLEKLRAGVGRQRLFSIRASDELRVLLAWEGATAVLLRAGHHDAVYRFAQKSGFLAPRVGKPGLIAVRDGGFDQTPTPTPQTAAPRTSSEPAGPSILEHWRTSELTRAGFDAMEIEKLRKATKDTLLDEWDDIDDPTLDKVIAMSEQDPSIYFQRDLLGDEERRNQQFREAITANGALAGLSPLLDAEEIRRLAAAPIEDWMIFLHPEQRTLVDRQYSGPARVRGSAGTGKTVVALHRAAALARRYAKPDRTRPKILFTTYIASLPPVFEHLYQRLPNHVPNAVRFVNIDKLAADICRQSGQAPRLDRNAATKAFNEAYNAIVLSGTPLRRNGFTRGYLRVELERVLKGRDVQSLEDYLAMQRTGRRTPLSGEMREQVWRLGEEWDRHLGEAGIVAFPDVVRRARDLARRRTASAYRAAIVDESQDLTLVGLQLIRALVDGDGQDAADSLFIVGDSAQKIYAGGFTPAQAGVKVRGRSAVLRLNYRNTHEIMAAAMACTGQAAGDGPEAGSSGVRPLLASAADFDGQVARAVEQIRKLRETSAVGFGDVGVFAPTNHLANDAEKAIQKAGLPCQSLRHIDGRPNDRIKVGTFHRAKGLEFKVVFLLDLSAGCFPQPRDRWQSQAEYEDEHALAISTLFVAMTRARDRLFILYSGEPADVIYEGIDCIDIDEFD